MEKDVNELLESYGLNEIIDFEIRDKYYYVKFKVSGISLEEAKRLVSFRLDVTNHTPCYALINAKSVKYQDKETTYYLNNEGAEKLIASAVVLSNFKTMFVNLALFFMNKNVEGKAFTNDKQAKEWLLEKINEQTFN